MKSEPVVIIMSVLAGLQILTAGSALGDVIGAQTAALLVLVVAAAQGAIQFYVRSKVTANTNVVARREATTHDVIAGDAAPAAAGMPEGTRVEVTPTMM